MTQNARYPELASVYARMNEGGHVTVAYLGGSITWGAQATDPMKTSYRARVTKHLEQKFPNARLHAVDAAIGGTPSKLGVFRMDRDVLPYKPDLTFVEFCVNDGASADSQETMEGIVRKLRKSNPQMAIVINIIGAGKDYGARNRPKHIELADYYGLPYVDICGTVRGMLDRNEITNPDILEDGVHPNDRGYALYADLINKTMDAAATEKGAAVKYPEKTLTANHYERAALLELAALQSIGDWKKGKPSLVGTWFDHQPSRWMNSVVVTDKKAEAKLPLPAMTTDGVGLYYEIFKGAGRVQVRQGDKVLLTAKTDMNMPEHRVGWTWQLLDALELRQLNIIAADHLPLRVAYVMYLHEN